MGRGDRKERGEGKKGKIKKGDGEEEMEKGGRKWEKGERKERGRG
jgi:hypothetical protein